MTKYRKLIKITQIRIETKLELKTNKQKKKQVEYTQHQSLHCQHKNGKHAIENISTNVLMHGMA